MDKILHTLKNAVKIILWYLLGGSIMGLVWYIAGLIMYVSIIGIPYGKVCLAIARYNFYPAGDEVIDENLLMGRENFGPDCFSLSRNQMWFLTVGIWLLMGHFIFGIVNFITIIGISSGHRHLKLACISLAPLGKIIVTKESVKNARKLDTLKRVERLRNELSVY